MKLLLLVATKKGLFLLTSSDRLRWDFHGPFLKGKEVNHAIYDRRTRRIFATSNDAWFGCEMMWSDDLGQSWNGAKQNPSFAEDSGLKLERIWHIEPGRENEPDVMYAGVAPAALFKSEDRGETWHEVKGLTSHATRSQWHPGAGGLCLHSIIMDHGEPGRMYVGISAVGVFRTEDDGKTWHTANRGTRAEFLPEKYPEYGQCVHKLLLAPGGKFLFQQNHCGVYRSEDQGVSWTEITQGLPSDFGFPLAIHPHEPETIYVLPLQGGEFRCPPDAKLTLYRSRDGGRNWAALREGLPQQNAFMGVYREGMCTDILKPAGIYFGTNTGELFGSVDEGDRWRLIETSLPPIFSVSTAVLEG